MRNRNDELQQTATEKAIYAAMREVERMGADVRLTEAVTLLDAARNKVADFVDEKETLCAK